jgi:hypothetical protein
VLVPAGRVVRWFANFETGHGDAAYSVADGTLRATAADGSTAEARLPFECRYDGPALPEHFAAAVLAPSSWGVLLVRKGGFAVARLEGLTLVEHKIGQRHVQGRTKAGGQSQQRFARRRDNQARAAYDAAADHAARILAPGGLQALVVGGDHAAVEAVLGDPRLQAAASRRAGRWLPVPDPRRAVLDRAVLDACSVEIAVTNA